MLGAFAQIFGLRGATVASGLACIALAAWIVQRSRGLTQAMTAGASLD
jgi:hypothetical protein